MCNKLNIFEIQGGMALIIYDDLSKQASCVSSNVTFIATTTRDVKHILRCFLFTFTLIKNELLNQTTESVQVV